MDSFKQEAINAISKLPENVTVDEIMYRLYVIDKIKKAQEAVEGEETITIDELKREMETW